MKRIASIVAVVVGVTGATAGTAAAGNNAVQVASIYQSSTAYAPATQFGGGALVNINSSSAVAANYASINQWLTQFK